MPTYNLQITNTSIYPDTAYPPAKPSLSLMLQCYISYIIFMLLEIDVNHVFQWNMFWNALMPSANGLSYPYQ